MSTYQDPYYQIQVGDVVTLEHEITKKDVNSFADLTGDDNPLHMDDQFAREANFGSRVVHGMLSASFISTIIGTKMPGKGALWQSQTLNFLNPARISDVITVKATCKQKSDAQRVIVLDIEVANQDNKLLITGEASVKVLEPPQEKKQEYNMVDNTKGAAIISGASRGIGAAIAKQLAADGFSVVINYNNSEDQAKIVENEILEIGGNCSIFKADITSSEEVANMVQFTTEKYGAIEALVSNASGAIKNNSFSELDWENIQSHLDIQLKGTFNLCKKIVPIFKERKYGKIINIISTYTDDAPPAQVIDYAIAKTALHSFSKSLAVELGPLGIQVNCVSPGMTETSLLQDVPEKTKLVTKMQTPLRRLGNTSDVANAVSFLASDKSNYITGETIRVCGGQKMI